MLELCEEAKKELERNPERYYPGIIAMREKARLKWRQQILKEVIKFEEEHKNEYE